MRPFFSLALLLLLCCRAGAQIPIEDAVKLKSYIVNNTFDSTKTEEIKAIFKLYANPPGAFQFNPFIKRYMNKDISKTLAAGEAGTPTTGADNPLSAASSFIIDRFSVFIVERIKKELQAAFFEKFYALINKPEYQDCRTLFPNTYRTLLAAGTEIYNYELYLDALRTAFGNDLQIILPNLDEVIRNGRFSQFFKEHTELRRLCLSALFIGKNVQAGMHVGSILETYDPYDRDYSLLINNAKDSLTRNDSLYANIFTFVKAVSKSLQASAPGPGRYWADANTIGQVLADKDAFNCYMGLLYARVFDLPYDSINTFGDLLSTYSDNITLLQAYFLDITQAIKKFENVFSELAAIPQDQLKDEDYFRFFNATLDLLESFRRNEPFSQVLTGSEQAALARAWETYDLTVESLRSVLNIYTGLKTQQYSLVMQNVRSIYETAFNQLKIDPAGEGQKKAIQKVLQFLFEYGSVVAGVAAAKSSEQVYAAINKVALPTGSSRLKKESDFSISLNAYGGFFLGYEKVHGHPADRKVKINNYGVTAPVGIALSAGRIKWPNGSKSGNKSLTLFLSVIDLGAPVSFRFTNNDLNEVPSISWGDIVAPGAHLIYGFGKVPLSFSVGWQTGPNLRKVKTGANEYAGSPYSRWSAALLVDIPVFNIYTKR